MKIILSINAGSSSVRVSVYSAESGRIPTQLAEGQLGGLTSPPAQIKYTRGDATVLENQAVKEPVKNQSDAFAILLQTLVDDEVSQISPARMTLPLPAVCTTIIIFPSHFSPFRQSLAAQLPRHQPILLNNNNRQTGH
jgi:hypothetical protein